VIDFFKHTQESAEVFLSNQPLISIKSGDIDELKKIAEINKSGKARFCSHSHPDETLHEMFIVHKRNTYVRPHRHLCKPESMLVLEGIVDYIMFDENGEISDVVRMDDYRSGNCFYQSIRKEYFHSLLIRSEQLVFLEITKGPFCKADTEFASWSPSVDAEDSVDEYMKNLEKNVDARVL
jgi:cupin fold WbuC family metalloprotein